MHTQLRHLVARYLHTWEHARWMAMPSRKPEFNVGNNVREKFQTIGTEAERGVVTGSYEFNGHYRYVVKCVRGREAVFFEQELALEARNF
jgi:hypothetical protein